tara:strand:- start:29 stop:292 length:264 start_codon:yes stop_codon:yes gene_type:complete
VRITDKQLRQIIREEKAKLNEALEGSDPGPLERTHQGKVITPQSIAGKLFNLAAEVEALGEDFFSDSDSLAAWANDFITKHNIMKGR